MSLMRTIVEWSDAHRAAKTVSLLRPWVHGHALDVGSWDGLVASQLDADVVGIDVCEPPPNTVIPVTRFNGREIPFEDKAFDTVLCCTALHHADDQTALLSEMLRVGRRVVILEDSYDSFVERTSVLLLHVMSSRVVSMPYRKEGFRSLLGWTQFFAQFPCRVSACERHPGIMPVWYGLRHYLFELESTQD